MSLDLLSATSRVETPFIIAEIAGISFGIYNTETKNIVQGNSQYKSLVATYPNFMNSLTVTKINGTVNTYNLVMVYAIAKGDDPNLLEKVFSKAKKDRTIYLSYGDLSLPSYIYKREEALISNITSNIDFSGSKITYNISCTSKAVQATSGTFNFPKRKAKPSDVIKELLYNNTYGLLEIFYGMRDKGKVLQNYLIISDDASVMIEAKNNISPLKYLEYLVTCMIPENQDANTILKNSMYRISIYDDLTNDYNGPYFKVTKISSNLKKDTLNTYIINIGYPDQNIVTNFSINDNQVYSILYDYSNQVDQPKYIQRIDNNGNLVSEYSPSLSNSNNLLRTTASDKTWWTNMTSFPINVTLTIKGLIKPAILMSYVYLDCRFYGNKHYSSGYYTITKQTDSVSASGFKTTLNLLRVGGDDDY